MFELDDVTVTEVIRLADNYRVRGELWETACSAQEVGAWWGRPVPEWEALTNFIRSRPRLEQYDLLVLYQTGERGEPPEDWDAEVEKTIVEIDDPADYLAGKLHLGEYLRKAWGIPADWGK